jgi:NAD(P)-dependent dehydrogenase (short-subunit alcohol dehydrogenase family)
MSDRRRAIVTGAGSGIGRATALLLAERGYDVGITYLSNRDGALAVARSARERGARVVSAQLDLAQLDHVEPAVRELIDELGGVDVLVNNAAVNPRGTTLEATAEAWTHTLHADLVGPWACARAVAADMIERGVRGRIVNVTSVLASAPLHGGGMYCAAKAGLDILTRVMALELAEHGIAVNAVAPGHTATPMNFAPDQLDGTNIERPVIPLGRAAAAEEVARAIVFLAGDEASYVTGSSLLVDGGLLLASGPQQLQDETGLPPDSGGGA